MKKRVLLFTLISLGLGACTTMEKRDEPRHPAGIGDIGSAGVHGRDEFSAPQTVYCVSTFNNVKNPTKALHLQRNSTYWSGLLKLPQGLSANILLSAENPLEIQMDYKGNNVSAQGEGWQNPATLLVQDQKNSIGITCSVKESALVGY